MAGIFTRDELNRIMTDESLTPEQRTEQVYSLYGRALEDGYVSRGAAQQAQEAAVEAVRSELEKNYRASDVKDSEEYRALQAAFDDYRTMQQARTAAEFAQVKPKFFETVYGMLERGEGAADIAEQLERIREAFEEYFLEPDRQEARLPRFGAPTQGSMPRGDGGAAAEFSRAWGFGGRR